MKLSEELVWRGFYNQTTFTSPDTLDQQSFTLYLGTDPTADSLHVGHLAVYMMVRRFLDHGHKVVLLVGGGTGVIGDPSGKSDERNLLGLEEIAKNKAALKAQVSNLFSGKEFQLVDNYDWLKDVSILDFLRDAGKHFGMGTLIQRDYIANRIGEGGSGMSYAEFSYTLLQGYDFWHLYKQLGVNLQIGGSDQWGNILSGVDLVRKKEAATVHGMTAPLVINKATGKKFGKSEAGAVWLDPAKTSVYQFYQFWLNVGDDSAIDYLKLFTLLDKEVIAELENKTRENPSGREAQKTLAYEITELVHGTERADSVRRISEVLFGGADYATLEPADFELLVQELPVADASVGADLIASLVETGLAGTNSEARRFLQQGAIYVNGQQVPQDKVLSPEDAIAGYVILRRGKNSNAVLKLQG